MRSKEKESQHHQPEESFPVPGRIRASAGFADRVMARIAEESSPKVVRLPVAYRIMSVASLALICISIGILIGSHSGVNSMMRKKKTKQESLKQFRDNYHLYSVRTIDLMMGPAYK